MMIQVEADLTLHRLTNGVCVYAGTSRSRSHTASSHQWLVCMHIQVEVGLTLHHHTNVRLVCMQVQVEVGLTLHHHIMVCVCMHVEVEAYLTQHRLTNGVCMQVQI